MVVRTRLSVVLYVHRMSCISTFMDACASVIMEFLNEMPSENFENIVLDKTHAVETKVTLFNSISDCVSSSTTQC